MVFVQRNGRKVFRLCLQELYALDFNLLTLDDHRIY